MRQEADGWTFKRTSSSCSGEAWESFYKVLGASGQVVETGRHQIGEADNGCIDDHPLATMGARALPNARMIHSCAIACVPR